MAKVDGLDLTAHFIWHEIFDKLREFVKVFKRENFDAIDLGDEFTLYAKDYKFVSDQTLWVRFHYEKDYITYYPGIVLDFDVEHLGKILSKIVQDYELEAKGVDNPFFLLYASRLEVNLKKPKAELLIDIDKAPSYAIALKLALSFRGYRDRISLDMTEPLEEFFSELPKFREEIYNQYGVKLGVPFRLSTSYYIDDGLVNLLFHLEDEKGGLYHPWIRVAYNKQEVDEIFEYIKKDAGLPKDLDLYPALDGAILEIWDVPDMGRKAFLYLNMNKLKL